MRAEVQDLHDQYPTKIEKRLSAVSADQVTDLLDTWLENEALGELLKQPALASVDPCGYLGESNSDGYITFSLEKHLVLDPEALVERM